MKNTRDGLSRLAKKGRGKEAKLCFAGHVLIKNRTGLVVDVTVTQAMGIAERKTAIGMLKNVPGEHR